jgi:hypothetical protein
VYVGCGVEVNDGGEAKPTLLGHFGFGEFERMTWNSFRAFAVVSAGIAAPPEHPATIVTASANAAPLLHFLEAVMARFP